MRIVDIFAGPGGWDTGLSTLGYHDVIGVELDDAACATRKAAGHATVQGDVAALNPSDFGPIVGLIASPPCQDFSLAGKRAGITGTRGELIHQVIRWVEALNPTWIACEQVPPALPVWELFVHQLRRRGYKAWSGVLNAADYGVPQTRRRAILMATRGTLTIPEPTHANGGSPPDIFGNRRQPWITWAKTLGWENIETDSEWTLRHGTQPNACVRRTDQPAGTIAFGHDAANTAFTNAHGATIQITVEQAAILQGYPADYPWQGSRTKQFEQIGNSVPPPFAAAICQPLIEGTSR